MEDWKKDVTRFCENTGLVLWFPAFHSTKEMLQPCLTYLHVISLIVAKDTSRGSRGSWEQAGRSRPQNGGSEWCLSAVSGPEPPIFTTPPKHVGVSLIRHHVGVSRHAARLVGHLAMW